MKIIIVILLAIGLIINLLGVSVSMDTSQPGEDRGMGSAMMWVAGIGCWGLAAILALVWWLV